jgi:hypothetical protein
MLAQPAPDILPLTLRQRPLGCAKRGRLWGLAAAVAKNRRAAASKPGHECGVGKGLGQVVRGLLSQSLGRLLAQLWVRIPETGVN